MPPRNPLTELLNTIRDSITHAADIVEDSFEQAERIQAQVQKAAQRAQRIDSGRSQARRGRVQGQNTPPGKKSAQRTPKQPELSFYDILEVSPRASQETITAAFRSLSLKFHPDKSTGSDKLMKRITEAYTTLKDAEKRRQYDRSMGM